MENVKVVSFEPQNGINAKAHRKENHFQDEYAIIAYDRREFIEPVTLRIYGTSAKNYACLWIHSNQYASGSGSAGGYGYHRPSAAAQEAISKAGFELSQSIDGRGDSAIQRALEAIATHLGYKTFTLHHANG